MSINKKISCYLKATSPNTPEWPPHIVPIPPPKEPPTTTETVATVLQMYSDDELPPVIIRNSTKKKAATVPPEEVERQEGSPEGPPTTTETAATVFHMDSDDETPPLIPIKSTRKKSTTAPPLPKAPEGPLTTIVTAVTVSSQIDSDNKPPPLYDRETKTLSFPQFPLKISFDAEIYTTTPHPSSTSVAPTTFISDTDRVTKTTNKTAGSIPDINLVKRKLEYEREEAWKKVSACPPLPIRRLRHRMMLSYGATTRENKLYYHLLPDGVISAFAANGTANGRHGYVQPAMKAVNTMLREMEDGNPDPIALNTNITKILPIRDPLTSRAKKVSFANHAKKNGCNVLCLRLQRYK